MTIKIDSFDVKIIAALQEDGRQTKLELADKIGLSPTPCWRRLERLEQEGIITKYRAKVNTEGLGLNTFFVSVQLDTYIMEDIFRFRDVVSARPEVQTIYSLFGPADYMLKIVTASTEEFAELMAFFLEQKIGIRFYQSVAVGECIKDVPVDLSYHLKDESTYPRDTELLAA